MDFSKKISNSMAFLNALQGIAKFKCHYLATIIKHFHEKNYNESKEYLECFLSSVKSSRFKIKTLLHKLRIANDTHAKVVDKSVFDYNYSIDNIMRIYAILDVVTLFPFLLAGFFGMNIQLPMEDWDYSGGFILIVAIAAIYILSAGLWTRKLRHHK